MIHRIKSVFCIGLCCGLVMFVSIPYVAFALLLTKQTKGIEEVQNEVSYFSNAGMGEENPSVDPAGSPRAAGDIIYRISTGHDWDELLRGNLDPTCWFGGDGFYMGTQNVTIILDNNMVVDINSIRLISTDITFTLDLNGYSLMVVGGTLSVKSLEADGTERKGNNTFILKDGTMDATGIDTAGGMQKIDIQQVDFVNMLGDAVLCDGSDEVSNCTFSHGAGSNTDTAIHVPDSGTIKISDVVVSGYAIGLQCGSNAQMEIADIEVKDCGTGLKGGRFLGLRRDNATDSYIHDCDYGIDCDQLGLTNTNLHVYDCKETGVQIHKQLVGPRLLEIYNCKDGLITDGSLVIQVHLQIHDNTGNGLAYTGSETTITIDSSMEIYDNGGWNIYGDNVPSSFCVGKDLTGEFTCRLENGGLGNMNINPKNSSGSGYMLKPTRLKSDESVYYVYPGKEVCISPQSDPSWTDGTDWLDGCMVFDIQNYIEGAVAAYVPETNIRTTLDQREDTWNFVRTHFFAAEEGWVIQYDKDAPANMSAYPLAFAKGCNVAYDYETNGGTGMSGTYSKITYLDGEAVDLSLSAERSGYEFIGWNTDPDATEGLETLEAGTKDITLYAIYKKTAYISNHTYDADSDYTAAVTFYNNEDKKESGLATYNAGGDNTFVGYVLEEDATVSSADDVLAAGDNVTVSPDGLDIYCVYEKQGQLDYLKKDGSVLSTERDTVYEIGSDNKKFEYTVRAGEPVTGVTFKEWKDAAGNSFGAGNTIRTEDKHIILTPVYEVYQEPTTEEPTKPPVPTPTKTPEVTEAPTEAPTPTKTPEVTKAPTEAPTKPPAPTPTNTPEETKVPTEEPTKPPVPTPTETPEVTKAPTEAPAKKGAKFTSGKLVYKVSKAVTAKKAGTLTVTALSNSGKRAGSLSIPATATIKGYKYNVTKIGNNVFKGAKAKSVALGKNIKAIPKGAFANCKKLSTLTIKTKLKSVKKGAFKGCRKTIKVKGSTKKNRKANVKLLKKKSGYKKFK